MRNQSFRLNVDLSGAKNFFYGGNGDVEYFGVGCAITEALKSPVWRARAVIALHGTARYRTVGWSPLTHNCSILKTSFYR